VEDLKGQGMEAVILDVRDNPGGMVTSVTKILDDILPEGTVVYTQDKYGSKQEFTSEGDTYMDYPLAVLMNGNSASASEILAGAIRDFEYGTLIGTTTYGKGVVQTIYPLSDGDAIKLTTAKYFTPKGENIHGTGIEPDVELEFDYQGDRTKGYDEMQDNQVLKALEVLDNEIKNGKSKGN
jgi:carboxyl-terminal processing protease